MRRLLMDTDIAIDYLRGDRTAVAFVREHKKEISLSAVTVAELSYPMFRRLRPPYVRPS